mgnify:CR=1 FL=1
MNTYIKAATLAIAANFDKQLAAAWTQHKLDIYEICAHLPSADTQEISAAIREYGMGNVRRMVQQGHGLPNNWNDVIAVTLMTV